MKRALIITYYWPPAGGPGVQRWLQFVKHFKEFDVEPIVYIPENPFYPLQDPGFLSEVPEDIEIIKHPISEPYRLARLFSKNKTKQISSGIIKNKKQGILEKLMLYVRGNYFIPDARIGWVKPSVKFLEGYLAKNPVDVLITSGPPHSLHLIGMQLKNKIQLKWLADFRDPWTTIHYHNSLRLTEASKKKHKDLERKVLNTADTIVVTSPTTKAEFENITDTSIEVITNGYVPTKLENVVMDGTFSIAHIGSMLSERDPVVLWRVLSEIASENSEFKKDLKIRLAGTISDTIVDSLSEYGLKQNCDLIGYVDHSEAISIQHSSQVLLLVEIDSEETRSIIPGKLFEYLAARRPIIAIGPNRSDIEGIIKDTNSGEFFNPERHKELKETIIRYYSDFKKGRLSSASEGIEKYSRRELSRQMTETIKSL